MVNRITESVCLLCSCVYEGALILSKTYKNFEQQKRRSKKYKIKTTKRNEEEKEIQRTRYNTNLPTWMYSSVLFFRCVLCACVRLICCMWRSWTPFFGTSIFSCLRKMEWSLSRIKRNDYKHVFLDCIFLFMFW